MNTPTLTFKPFTGSHTPHAVPATELARLHPLPKGVGQISSEHPPLTIELLRDNLELVARSAAAKGANIDLTAVLNADTAFKSLHTRLEASRREANECANSGQRILKDHGKDSGQFLEIRRKGTALKDAIASLEKECVAARTARDEKFSWVPNLLDPEVPLGGAEANKLIRATSIPQITSFSPKDHVALGIAQDWIDFEGGVKVAGRGFYFLKGDLYLLRQTIAMIVLNNLSSQGFTPSTTPVFANAATLYGTGYHPWAAKENFALNDGSGLAAIGTSEQPLLGQFIDTIIPASKLPVLLAADTQCFRTEISSGGADARGMKRVHQFGKVEQIIICKPEDVGYWHERALANEEDLLNFLEIPHRVVLLAAGDMGLAGYKKYDVEAWLPSKQDFIELTSNTNFRDFQSRRLKLRYKPEDSDKNSYPYTISATGFSDRLLIAFLENHQQADGTIRIPERLQPYFGNRTSIGRAVS